MNTGKSESKVLTIPNILSFIRLIMIPFIVWAYYDERPVTTAILLIASGISDVADGIIARKYDLISNLGKILDPLADKLTQGVVLICLVAKYRYLIALVILMVIKETTVTATGFNVFTRTKKMRPSEWHGKIATVLIYLTMFLHIVWTDIPLWASLGLLGICFVTVCISLVLYTKKNLAENKNEK